MVFHYASDVGRLSPAATKDLHISVAETILNKQAGWKALTGTTNFGAIADPSSTDPAHQLAFDLFVDRICGFVGSYYVSLGGAVDALVFAGGIGEKSARLRAAVVDKCACLGFAALDQKRNESSDEEELRKVVREATGGGEGGRHRVLVVQTDEQFEMARGAAEDTALWAVDDNDDEETPDLSLLKVVSGHD